MITQRLSLRILVPIAFLISTFGCTKEDILEIDVAPQLELTVLDSSGNNVVGASVSIYSSEANWESRSNPIQENTTDASGKVLFKELNQIRYFFYVSKGAMNNYYDIASFTNPLRMNEIRTLNCTIN